MFGVSVADLKTIAKQIKGDQALALELYDTGNYDAMYLAGLVADGSQMSKRSLSTGAIRPRAKQSARTRSPGSRRKASTPASWP